jgi:lipopolysaccharide/colanic/teichoic acid biosynthesis glycosyltransferase
MRPASESAGQITVGMRDPRITSIGYGLRKYKLDELPQLLNILKGEMSVVGPRPEVPRYVALYNDEQRKVLNVKPGLTDYASIDFVDENAILAKSSNPEKTYIEEIMPLKLNLNKKYIQEMGMKTDIKIIFGTVKAIFK